MRCLAAIFKHGHLDLLPIAAADLESLRQTAFILSCLASPRFCLFASKSLTVCVYTRDAVDWEISKRYFHKDQRLIFKMMLSICI